MQNTARQIIGVQQGYRNVFKPLPDKLLSSVTENNLRKNSAQIRELAFYLKSARDQLLHLLNCSDPTTPIFFRNKDEDLSEIVEEWVRVIESINHLALIPRVVESVFEESTSTMPAIEIIFPADIELAIPLVLPKVPGQKEKELLSLSRTQVRVKEKVHLGMDFQLINESIVSIGKATATKVDRNKTDNTSNANSHEKNMDVAQLNQPTDLEEDGLKIGATYLAPKTNRKDRELSLFTYSSAHEALSMAGRHFASYLDVQQNVGLFALGNSEIRQLLHKVLANWFPNLESCVNSLPSELQAAISWLQSNATHNAVEKPEPNISHTTHIVNSTYISAGDQFNVSGKAGAVGPNAQSYSYQQLWSEVASDIDLTLLATELRLLLNEAAINQLKNEAAITSLKEALLAAEQKNGPKTLEYLKQTGKWILNSATKVGVGITTAIALKKLGF